ncbi:pescadillo homolog isoform X2 [Sipha flava]|nr:pescadillo homolog isoform X2 [Sipha flava]
MIIRIKRQEHDIDVESKDSSVDQEDIVTYTCEFVQKDDDDDEDVDDDEDDDDEDDEDEDDDDYDETLSELSDICDDESVRQDENFIYPAITNSDDEDTTDVTWQPPNTILSPTERLSRKNTKCLYSKVGKSVTRKKKCNNKKTCEEPAAKRLKKERLPKIKKVLEDIYISKPDTNLDQPVETTSNELMTKKIGDSLIPKVYKPRKGMATPKQRLGRIIKIHKLMK